MGEIVKLITQLLQLLSQLQASGQLPVFPDPTPPPLEFSRIRFRLLRIQYNRRLYPDMFTEQNPDGVYSGKVVRRIESGEDALNRECNAWLDLTAYDAQGLELNRQQIERLRLSYKTAFSIGDGFIRGNGPRDNGTPEEWEKQNPTGANISEETWRTSRGFTVRVHFADEGSYECSGSVDGNEGGAFTIRVS